MPFLLQPWHILLAALSGMVNQRQQQIIEFQNAQIEALLKKLGHKRLLLDDDQRRLLGLMWKAVLVSPQFLFITPGKEVDSKDPIVPLDDYQLASRLSYLLWSAPPDAELSALADKGELHNPEVLRAQVERLLKHDRSRALFDGFGAQWLGVGGLERQTFDPDVFPQMTPVLRKSMLEEARLFFQSIVRENQSVFRFVDSDYTFLNEPLAELYGLEQSVQGTTMRRVKLENPNRGGILGMPATLAATSFPNRTSPVRRGVWVLEQVLGERVPPPPPDVPDLAEQEQKSVEGLTLRQRTELHQSEPTCANCHKVLDPIGFGLENFDAIGRWREKNGVGVAIDSVGKLPNGESFSTPAELKGLLARRKADLARNLTERLMAHRHPPRRGHTQPHQHRDLGRPDHGQLRGCPHIAALARAGDDAPDMEGKSGGPARGVLFALQLPLAHAAGCDRRCAVGIQVAVG